MASPRFLASILTAAISLAGCAHTRTHTAASAKRLRVEPPPQPANSLRLIIYRPQQLVGVWGQPVIVVNGRKMLTALSDSMLDPGSVFVVDAPAEHTLVEWIQSRKSKPSTQSLVINGLQQSTRYLRWTLKPTFGYLEPVTAAVARVEIGPLHYMGYRNVVAPLE